MPEGTRFTLWLEFEQWNCSTEGDCENDFFNMKVTLESGKSYALNVWTFGFLERAVHSTRFEDRTEQEKCLPWDLWVQHPVEREYLKPPDLLVARLDRNLIEEIVAHLLREHDGELPAEWECSPRLEPE